MKQIMDLTSSIIIAGSIIVAGYIATSTFAGLYQQAIANEARYQCALSSKYLVKQNNNVEVSYPVQDLYNKCLTEKNIQ